MARWFLLQVFAVRAMLAVVALTALMVTSVPAHADPPHCRLKGDATITAGDEGSGSAHSTDFLSSLGIGRWRHITPSGDRFDGRISIFSCHTNTGVVADFEGTGSFAGSSAVLTFQGHIEDRTTIGQPDFYAFTLFNGAINVYLAAGQVVSGDFVATELL